MAGQLHRGPRVPRFSPLTGLPGPTNVLRSPLTCKADMVWGGTIPLDCRVGKVAMYVHAVLRWVSIVPIDGDHGLGS